MAKKVVKLAQACAATKKDGSPCSGFAGKDSPYCFAHDPKRRQSAQNARLDAAKATNRKKVPILAQKLKALKDASSHEGLAAILAQTIKEVRAGRCDSMRANAIVGLVREQRQMLKETPGQNDAPSFEHLTTEQLLARISELTGLLQQEPTGSNPVPAFEDMH